LLKPASENWYLVCFKCKKDCCTCFLTKQLIAKDIYGKIRVRMAAGGAPVTVKRIAVNASI
jgi:hypothetical protein